jgi:signal transduction histidine kinase
MTAERRQTTFQQIDQQITKLTDMIDGVLSISRTQTGKTDFAPTLIELEPFCLSILEQIRFGDTADHQFEFSSHIPDRPIMIDSDLLNHILTNLLSNAVKYSPEHSRITFELTQDHSNIVIKVSDEGIGIPEEDQARLFEPFHRAGNVGDVSGTGLGLSIVKEYVELHGGRIEVESEVGKGTSFIITLPTV